MFRRFVSRRDGSKNLKKKRESEGDRTKKLQEFIADLNALTSLYRCEEFKLRKKNEQIIE